MQFRKVCENSAVQLFKQNEIVQTQVSIIGLLSKR